MGADINRGKNKLAGLKGIDSGLFENGAVPNFRMFTTSKLDYLTLNVNLQLLVRVESNLKLNIFDNESEERFMKSDQISQNEIHFLLMEGIIGGIEAEEITSGHFDTSRHIKDWTVVDIDHFLKGNPHVQ